MSKLSIPQNYHAPLSVYELQRAIEFIKSNFQVNLGNALNLRRVSAPLFVDENSGLNDNLNGVERPVSFDIPDVGINAQVVHSLAKWKRLALKRYEFNVGKGLFTDMNAIRRDEEVDNLHSIYVDQWDWEKVISREDRNEAYLERTVRDIVGAVCETNDALGIAFPSLHTKLDREVFFITTQELEDMYPGKTPKERENAILREHHTVFLMQIGGKLRSGKPHDGRAPDYDDWALNGDILMWNPVLECAFEISSMGIRVDEESMARQLKLAGCEERRELPLTMGGGIGFCFHGTKRRSDQAAIEETQLQFQPKLNVVHRPACQLFHFVQTVRYRIFMQEHFFCGHSQVAATCKILFQCFQQRALIFPVMFCNGTQRLLKQLPHGRKILHFAQRIIDPKF